MRVTHRSALRLTQSLPLPVLSRRTRNASGVGARDFGQRHGLVSSGPGIPRQLNDARRSVPIAPIERLLVGRHASFVSVAYRYARARRNPETRQSSSILQRDPSILQRPQS
jgi:hypothetical protein